MSFDMPQDEQADRDEYEAWEANQRVDDAAKVMEGIELAWANKIPDDATAIYRVVHLKGDRRLRCTDFYADEQDVSKALDRIPAEDLVLVQKFALTQ